MKPDAPLRSNPHVTDRCVFHVVGCPKSRRSGLVRGGDIRLKTLRRGVAKEVKANLIELEGRPDQVPVLCEVDPQYGIHRLVKNMQGRSSRLLRQAFSWRRSRLPTLWTNSYVVATAGGAPRSVIQPYLENQKRV